MSKGEVFVISETVKKKSKAPAEEKKKGLTKEQLQLKEELESIGLFEWIKTKFDYDKLWDTDPRIANAIKAVGHALEEFEARWNIYYKGLENEQKS